MKTKYIAILGTVATVLVTGSFITGKIIETNVNQVVEQLNGKNQPAIKILEYKRGLFSSDVELAYDLGGEPLILIQKIKHGPLMIGNTGRGFRINIGLARIETTPKTELKDKLSVTTVIGFSKSATSYLGLKNFSETEPTALRVNWNSMHGEFQHDLTFSKVKGSLNATAIEIATDQWQASIKELKYELNPQQKSTSEYSEALKVGNLSFTRNGNELLNLANAAITRNSSVNPGANSDQEFVNYLVRGNVERAKIVQKEFANEQFEFVADNMAYNRDIPMTSMLSLLINPRALVASAQALSQDSGQIKLKLEFPKDFSEALLAYLSFEIYRTSPIGQVDKRPENVVLKDISKSVNGLLREALKQKIIMERGSNYALNFDLVKR